MITTKRKKKKTKIKEKRIKGVDALACHLQVPEMDDSIEKVINAVDVQEKVKLARYIVKLCESLTSSHIIRNHIAKCKNCQAFLNSRKSLAELIIKGASIKR